jgi:hypothetical protein
MGLLVRTFASRSSSLLNNTIRPAVFGLIYVYRHPRFQQFPSPLSGSPSRARSKRGDTVTVVYIWPEPDKRWEPRYRSHSTRQRSDRPSSRSWSDPWHRIRHASTCPVPAPIKVPPESSIMSTKGSPRKLRTSLLVSLHHTPLHI